MRNLYYKLLAFCVFCLLSHAVTAQVDSLRITIADTLTAEQKRSTNRVILKSELDSLVKLNQAPVEKQEPVPVSTAKETALIIALALAVLVVILLIILASRDNNKHKKLIGSLEAQQNFLGNQIKTLAPPKKEVKPETDKLNPKQKIPELETKILSLNKNLEKLTKENGQLGNIKKEQEELKSNYEELKQNILKTFKIRHYPRSGEEMKDDELLPEWLETERMFATNVFERYIKPVHQILDANKKDPANTPEADKNKLIETLISLSLLYIEYLYLRVSELAIGGKISERINTIKKASTINESYLKPLDVEHGSKALVLYLALKEKNISELSYPVFDETNLNRK